MSEIWLTADTHFGHANSLKFLRDDGTPLRPFASVVEMDEAMIERWNAVVRPGDKVYHLGDVTFDYQNIGSIMARLNGTKRLVLGNHDRIKGTVLAQCFGKIELWKRFDEQGILATHLPAHDSSLEGKYTRNVHGHIHFREIESPRHVCVSVERTNYRPVNLGEINEMFRVKGWTG